MDFNSILVRREIYWQMYFVCEMYKSDYRLDRKGLCNTFAILKDETDYKHEIYYLQELNFIHSIPHSYLLYPLTKNGMQKRQDLLLKAIELTYKIRNHGRY